MDSDHSLHDDPGSPTDFKPFFHNDPDALTTDTANIPNDDPGLNTYTEMAVPLSDLRLDPGDGTSRQPIEPMESRQLRCINCGTDVTSRRRHNLVLLEVAAVIRQWIAPLKMEDSSIVCHSCWILALNSSRAQVSNEEKTSSSGHRRTICVNCGISLLRKRSHTLHTGTERETRIRKTIMEWIMPRHLRGLDQICHPCWQRSDRAAANCTYPNRRNQGGIITLPNFTRAVDTQSHCFFPQCESNERLAVPKWLRVKLFVDFKHYVPRNCRICHFHLHNDSWEVLTNLNDPIHTFTADHIQDFAKFVNERHKLSLIPSMSDETI